MSSVAILAQVNIGCSRTRWHTVCIPCSCSFMTSAGDGNFENEEYANRPTPSEVIRCLQHIKKHEQRRYALSKKASDLMSLYGDVLQDMREEGQAAHERDRLFEDGRKKAARAKKAAKKKAKKVRKRRRRIGRR